MIENPIRSMYKVRKITPKETGRLGFEAESVGAAAIDTAKEKKKKP